MGGFCHLGQIKLWLVTLDVVWSVGGLVGQSFGWSVGWLAGWLSEGPSQTLVWIALNSIVGIQPF
jgi:hypothetical protein